MKNYRHWLFLVVLIGLFFFYNQPPRQLVTTQLSPVEITGQVDDLVTAELALTTLEKNLQAASNNDLTGYLTTLVTPARRETQQELADFFNQYQLEHQLLRFTVLKQEATKMLVQTRQQTINLNPETDYRDHITEANHTFVLEGKQWLIKETIMTNTTFLKEKEQK